MNRAPISSEDASPERLRGADDLGPASSRRGGPTAFVVYGHDSELHQTRALDLAAELRRSGIPCRIDRDAQRPSRGWVQWFSDEIGRAGVVVVLCSRTLSRRLEAARPEEGHDWEAGLLRQRIVGTKPAGWGLVTVVFDDDDESDVPAVLSGVPRFSVPSNLVALQREIRCWLDPDATQPPSRNKLSSFRAPKDPSIPPPDDELASLYAQRDEVMASGGSTLEIQGRILELRRRIRDGGRLHPGDLLGDGRYALKELIGSGGFADVWKAIDKRHHDLVAIKVLHTRSAGDQTRRERFFRGARLMAELTHPGIVHVREDQASEEGCHYLVMAHVPGGDLRRAVRENRLEPAAVIELIAKVGEALQYAHDKGLVHRDVKPANILRDAAGAPLLTDFDLVGAQDTTGGTRDGLGTFGYAAPEAMADGSKADHLSDQFSLAMTAVFLLHGDDLPLDQIVRDPGAFVRGLPCSAWIRLVVGRALALRKEDRYPSVRAFCGALQEAARHPEPNIAPKSSLALEALVITGERMVRHPLPAKGRVAIGRSVESDIRIAHDSVSRHHAYLHVVEAGPEGGSPLRLLIEDRRSVNGTSIRDPMARKSSMGTPAIARLKPDVPWEIALGDSISLGQTTIVVRRTSTTDPRLPVQVGDPPDRSSAGSGIVVVHPAMRKLYDDAREAAASLDSVLLVGELGAGKATLAREIHRASPRAGQPFLVLSCAGASQKDVERILFGYGTGTLSIAGMLEAARGGTLFLDEVGELLSIHQIELARALGERKFLRPGGRTPRTVDFKLICSTSRDLDERVASGAFDADLRRRIGAVTLEIPPLRDRREEIAPLSQTFVESAVKQCDRPFAPRISREALAALVRYGWPGNVRELRAIVDRAVILCEGVAIMLDHLPVRLGSAEVA